MSRAIVSHETRPVPPIEPIIVKRDVETMTKVGHGYTITIASISLARSRWAERAAEKQRDPSYAVR